jgi:hypothetical protein
MTPAPLPLDRWHRIEELFHATSEMPEDQRAGFLRETCGSDDRLRDEVESLLASDTQESPLIAGIVDDATARLLLDDSTSLDQD